MKGNYSCKPTPLNCPVIPHCLGGVPFQKTNTKKARWGGGVGNFLREMFSITNIVREMFSITNTSDTEIFIIIIIIC